MSWVGALREKLGGADAPLSTDADVLSSFARDQAPLAPAGEPVALVRARSIADVTATLAFANLRCIPVVTRGAGTGLAGGANAVDGCILLSVAGMNRILAIDETMRTATVEPGVLNGDLAREAAARGLYYAPDPASRDISTIGGNIATNAGGSCCLKYGVTGDHVAALTVVLADGTLLHTGGRTKKNVAGLDLTRLIVGSEGTLGVVVEATVRLLRAPRRAATTVAFFDSLDDASAAIVAMDSLDLSLLEVMDQTTLRAVEELTQMQLDTDAAAFVLAQSDASDAAAVATACEATCAEHRARSVLSTEDAEEGRLLLSARRMALPALEKKGTTLLDDIAVPKPQLTAMIARIVAIGREHGVVIGTFGHAGDGNLHPTIVFEPRDPQSTNAAQAAFDAIVRAAVELGGTITGEHGVGSLKRDLLGTMLGVTERAVMQRVKAAFDPRGILNPGKAI
ncbi:MAG TPA: FAD-linked oxidase C-terminal domain-containing protein [Polyangiaceae bacterium]|jgi:D-lactate dehydrogenase (cytochrome)/glycolate oxidase|nr:FAD-linked oxidase C-terminal domain-containing protein [Polyangiaceae bacterium]